jgi:REP element-mobilizing transposase RayT
MAREMRMWIPGRVYHLFSRGSNKQPIFTADADYFDFAFVFAAACQKHQVISFAWSFMPNHWHLVARSPADGLSPFLKELNHRHALRFNHRHGRSAHIFRNRPGAVLQETEEQFLTTLRYVLRNPVEAGLAPTVRQASWTSFRCTIGAVTPPPFLAVEQILSYFGFDRETAIKRFEDFVELSR